MKVFISLGMRDKTIEEIKEAMNDIANTLRKILKVDIEIIDTIVEDYGNLEVKNEGLYCLGKSIELLSTADLVVFAEDWDSYRDAK